MLARGLSVLDIEDCALQRLRRTIAWLEATFDPS